VVPTYLIEFFLARSSTDQAGAITARIADAALLLQREGTPVRLVQALSIGDDELFQCVVDAPTPVEAEVLRRRAGLPVDGRPEQVDVLTLPHRRD
jgi:hypothetical protein